MPTALLREWRRGGGGRRRYTVDKTGIFLIGGCDKREWGAGEAAAVASA